MAMHNLPLYNEVVALCGDRHRLLGLTGPMSFNFAAHATTIPLGVSEFAIAATCFPIVFAVNEHPMPLAVVGLRDGENLFVDDQGRWTGDNYVPGWLRRYPFIATSLTGYDGHPSQILRAD